MTPALFVANYIIEYSNKKGYSINNLRLQKLLYFINARSLVETGNPIFKESMQKWKYGPVVPEVYHEYKQYGAFEILDSNIVKEKVDLIFGESEDDFPDIRIEQYDPAKINPGNKRMIELTVDRLNEFDAFDLVDITHQHPMWANDEEKIMGGEKGLSYDNNEIKSYFDDHEESQIWIN